MVLDARASYTDSFSHAFDVKGRITVPAEWRGGTFENALFVVPSSNQCLRVYPASWFGRLQEKVAQLKDSDPARVLMENFASSAQSAGWDQQGRMMVKENLRQRAGLKKDAVLVGRFDHFQIWDKAVWAAKEAAAVTVEEALRTIGQ